MSSRLATWMRFFAGLLVMSACLILVVVRPEWFRGIGVDMATFGRVKPQPLGLSEPDPSAEVVVRRFAAKARVVDQILARELDLFMAAALFRYLNQEPPECHLDHPNLPGKTDEEKLCRQVIRWVSVHGREYMDARELEQRLDELEAILAYRLGEGGRIVLPCSR